MGKVYFANKELIANNFKGLKSLVQHFKDTRRKEFSAVELYINKIDNTTLSEDGIEVMESAYKNAFMTLKKVLKTDKHFKHKIAKVLEDTHLAIKNQTSIVRLMTYDEMKTLDTFSRYKYNSRFRFHELSMDSTYELIYKLQASEVYLNKEYVSGNKTTFEALVDDKEAISQIKLSNHTWINLKDVIIKRDLKNLASLRTTNFTVQFEDSKDEIMDFYKEFTLEIRTPVFAKEVTFDKKRTQCYKYGPNRTNLKSYVFSGLFITCSNIMEGKAKFECKYPRSDGISLNGLYGLFLNYGKQKATPKFAKIRLEIFTMYDDLSCKSEKPNESDEPEYA